MKVGVITYSHSKDNYGQILQCYAMQQYLRQLGHESFLIRYKAASKIKKTGFKFGKVFLYLLKFRTYLKWFYSKSVIKKNRLEYENHVDYSKRNFTNFLSENLEITKIYSAEELRENPPYADAYICGSDQIWGGKDDIYYLSFAPDSSVKIAYAPSMGGVSYSDELECNIKKYLSRFNAIGMREESGVDVCKRMGFANTVKVVDPTMLLNSDSYKTIAKSTPVNKSYAFVYLLGNPIDISIEDISRHIKSMQLNMVYVASQGRHDDYPKIDATIEEWLGWIMNADLVITNSFHCTVFALQFHRNFIAIPLSGGYSRMNTRIEELLKESNLFDRIASSSFPVEALQEKDFEAFDAYKQSQQVFSNRFLEILNS